VIYIKRYSDKNFNELKIPEHLAEEKEVNENSLIREFSIS